MLPVLGPAVLSAAWVACPCATASWKVCMTLLQLAISALPVNSIRRPGVPALRSRTLEEMHGAACAAHVGNAKTA